MAYTINSTVGQILSDPRAVEILERHIPGASTHPQRHEAWQMSLGEVASYPESGLTRQKLEALLSDLASI
ncbi:MAG TPA: hypothetical protein P5121_22485 [Caldilineaceae bacterium]|nr:hypothetical protein [Caldilineaceae bacterium]